MEANRTEANWTEANQTEANRQKQTGQKVILLQMSIPRVAEVFAAYTVMSSSECEGPAREHDISIQS